MEKLGLNILFYSQYFNIQKGFKMSKNSNEHYVTKDRYKILLKNIFLGNKVKKRYGLEVLLSISENFNVYLDFSMLVENSYSVI